MARLGITVPFDDLALIDHRPIVAELVAAGYDEISSLEVNGIDGLSALLLLSGWQPQLTLTCAIVSAFTRGPALLAMTAAALAEAAPGRARFGIGAGSDRIVEAWNGIPFTKPYSRVAHTLAFLRSTLATGRPDEAAAAALGSNGFRLARVPATPPALFLAALGPRMQRLARAHADGVLLNFLSPDDLVTVRERTADTPREVDGALQVEARVFVVPGEGTGSELTARRHAAAYLTVPVYTNFQRWLGRGDELEGLLAAWDAGDRRKAVSVIPDAVIEDLFVMGDAARCAAGVQRYLDAGADCVTLAVMPPFQTPWDTAAQTAFLCELARHLTGA